MPKDPHDGDTRDDRVIFLLNRLGEQLIRSEKERLALGAKLARLEQQQQAQAGTLAKTENITKMVEEALASQGRLNRRLEQVNQDKIRINRKLERIEEAVVQTREALESKALVLLTGQGVADDSGKPQLPADMTQMAPVVQAAASFRDKKFMGYAASLTAIVLITLLGAWSAIKLATTDGTDTPAVVAQAQAPAPAAPAETAAATTPAPDAQTAPDATAQTDAAAAPPAAEQPAASAVTATGQPRPVMIHVAHNDAPPPAANEPGDSAADTDALAASLNEVAPAAGGAIPENLEKAAPPPPPAAAAAKPVSFTPKADTHADAGENPKVVETFISQQHDGKPLAQRVQPDPSLPPLAQQIEKKAIEGIPEAQHDLAALYTAGQAGVATDYKKAAFWFREAAVGGVANARYNLGVLYQQGLGVDRDLGKAISWYRAAAKLGHPEAEYNLGIAYIEGVGATYSPQIAARYFHQAASGGVVEADYNLGLVYENGLLGKPDRQEALYWYKRGADRDNKQATAALAQLEKVMKLSADDADKLVKGMHNDEAAQTAVPDEKSTPAKTAEIKTPDAEEKAPDAKAADVANGDGPDAADPADDAPVALNQPPAATGDTPAPAHDDNLTAQIQEQLIKRGLFPGPADGATSAQMNDAIRAYQSANGLASDGRATQALLAHMLSSEMKVPVTDGAPKKTSSAAGANGLNPGDLATPAAGPVSN